MKRSKLGMAAGIFAYVAISILVDCHVSLVSPAGSPGVLDDPVAEGGVADQQDDVVHIWVNWAAEDS